MLWSISEMLNATAFKPLPLCSAPLKTYFLGLLELYEQRKPLSKLKHILRKCSGVSQKWWMLDLSNLCHCDQHPSKPTSRDFWSSRNERKPLSKQTCVLRKCCGVSQKQWMLELSNLSHCVQHPRKLTSNDYWSSRTNRKPLSQLKHVLRKCSGVAQKWWVLELSNLCHCVQHPENLSARISGALGMKVSHFQSKNVFW